MNETPAHGPAPNSNPNREPPSGLPVGGIPERAQRDVLARDLRPGGVGLGRLFGVEVRLDWSLLLIFALISFDLATAVFPSWHPEWRQTTAWAVALAAAVLFVASILVHELSHALVGRSFGIPVPRITLFLFGGVAELQAEPTSPGKEFAMAIVGPVTSFVVGIGALLIASSVEPSLALNDMTDSWRARQVLYSLNPLATLCLWLGPTNIMLAIFNMIPGFPLDGGRVLRSLIWWITSDLTKATRYASYAGQFVAWALMTIGVVDVFRGAPGQGIWLLMIGWFLNNAARSSYERLLFREALDGVPIRRVMRTQFQSVDPDLTLEEFSYRFFAEAEQHAFPVERDGKLLGMISAADLRKIAMERWSSTRVAEIMTSVDKLATLPEEARAQTAAEELVRRDIDQIPVVRGAELLGIVRRADILRWVALRR